MRQLMSQAAVIARRDFLSIAGTPTFLIFLLAPLLMLIVSAASGLGAASMAETSAAKARLVVLADGDDAKRIEAANAALRKLYRDAGGPAALSIITPANDRAVQARQLLHEEAIETDAIMFGPLDRPTISFSDNRRLSGQFLAALAEQATRSAANGSTQVEQLSKPEMIIIKARPVTLNTRQAAGVAAVFAIFLLTLLLAGQTVGMLAEEKSNKVIEILAAAVRLEAVFFGKLLGMFGVAIVFIGFWGLLISIAVQFIPDSISLSGYQPAVGLPMFLFLCLAYFSMAFMLLGAVFLGIGAQAATMREIQMLSLPITIFQMAMFGLSSAAAGKPGSQIARIAEWFPFSSPFAMAAHGATDASLWPHFIALAWQAAWVAITIIIAARMFRAGVLKSGGGARAIFGFSRKARSV